MQWEFFQRLLPQLFARSAGGEYGEEVKKILPYREELFRRYPAIHYRPAAVLVLFYPDRRGLMHTVMIERNRYDGVHSGQIAFPGGKKEPFDQSLEQTALRETREEVGVPQEKVKIIRSLSPVKIPVSRFEVTPFMGYLDFRPDFLPDPSEVQNILELPLEYLINEAWCREQKKFENRSYEICYLPFDGYKIWGATAIVIAELRDLFKKAMNF